MNKGTSLALAISLLLITVLLQVGAPPAYAHFNTLAPDTDVQLQWPLNDSYSMSVDLKVVRAPESDASIFWGYQFTFMNGEKGFVALGIGGMPKVATVGVFNAVNATTSNPSGGCEAGISFLKSGNGYQCFIIFTWTLGSNYQLQFSRLSDSGGNEQWQGSIHDYSASSDTIIGNILVPAAFQQLSTNSSTWNEYSTASACNTTPTSVIFSHPNALNVAGNHAPTEAKVTYGGNACQDSNVQYLGGGAYQADAGSNVTRTTQPQTFLWTTEPQLVSENSTSGSGITSTTSTSSSSNVGPQTASSTASTTASSTSSTAASTTAQAYTTPTSSSNTTPLAVPAMPGFPWESIIAGIIIGFAALAMVRRRRS
ncbi:MAG: DUF3472 domain-containing protein [Candidatus Bathyarchaeia archaeon]